MQEVGSFTFVMSKNIHNRIYFKQKKWLNQYNARIRTEVGDELKAQFNMQAFYWMMNKTMHVIEYYPESEYRQRDDATYATMPSIWIWLAALFQIVGQIR